MSIAVPTSASAELSTFTGLVAAVMEEVEDDTIESKIPRFIAQAEARFNRILPDSLRETSTTLSTTATITLPSDLWQVKNVYLDTDPRRPLAQMTHSQLRTFYAAQTTGMPEAYALTGRSMVLGPAPDSVYDLELLYIQKIPALSNNSPTNWLLDMAPDIYFFATLMHAEMYLKNDERAMLLKDAVDEWVMEQNMVSNRMRYGAAPLRMRPSVIERI